MKVVIDIDENVYTRLFDCGIYNSIDMLNVCTIVRKGTPLPKGHGRLIDMKKLQNFVSRYTEHDAVQLILADREDYIPTIIEADKVESEDKE